MIKLVLSEMEVGIMQRILLKNKLCWWKYSFLQWNRSWKHTRNFWWKLGWWKQCFLNWTRSWI